MSDQPPDRAPRLTLAQLGEYGVNVVDSPLHCRDGELRVGQNVERSRNAGIGGLRKRKGIGLFTPSGLGGSILAIIAVPLPNPVIVTGLESFWLDGLPMEPIGGDGEEGFWFDALPFDGGGES